MRSMAKRKSPNPNDYFPLVAASFPEYKSFLKSKKIASEELIELHWSGEKFVGSVPFSWRSKPCNSWVEGEIAGRHLLKYSVKLFSDSFGSVPCARLCSRGSPHVNQFDGNRLRERTVPCPHFHRVDSTGWAKAYYGKHLPAEKRAEISKSVALGTEVFCQEFNVQSPSGGFVVLKQITESLALSTNGGMDSTKFP